MRTLYVLTAVIIALSLYFLFEGAERLSASTQQKQEQSEAGVIVKVTPESTNGALRFRVALETHIVNLEKFKFVEGVVLKASGKVFKARIISEEGSGHHRSAVVEFDDPGTAEVEVVIKDVAGVREWVFKF